MTPPLTLALSSLANFFGLRPIRRLDAAVADGDSNALVETYLQRREALLRYFTLRTGSAAQAEDIVQDIYLKLTGLDAEAVAGVRNGAAFLYRLGTNVMLDRLKQQRRGQARDAEWRRGEAVETAGEAAADAPSAEDVVAGKQRLAAMLAALNELTPPVRRAFRLHKLEGLSHAETAAAMGVSKSAIEKHVSAALKHLMKRLE